MTNIPKPERSIVLQGWWYDGGAFLNGCYIQPKCGCEVVGDGSLQFPLTIHFCARHAQDNPYGVVGVASGHRILQLEQDPTV